MSLMPFIWRLPLYGGGGAGDYIPNASFLIACPDIQRRAIKVAPSLTYDDDYPVLNAARGERYQVAQLAAASNTDLTIDFTLGTGNERAANYVIVARADLLAASVSNIDVYYSADGVSWTLASSCNGFASGDFTGPRLNDYISTFDTTDSKGYWRFSATSSGSSKKPLSKLYIGSFLDLGIDPAAYSIEINSVDRDPFAGDSGAEYFTSTAENVYKISLQWTGVTDAKAKEFMQCVAERKETDRFFLYTDSQHKVLAHQGLLHVECLDASRSFTQSVPDWNTITATFREVIG